MIDFGELLVEQREQANPSAANMTSITIGVVKSNWDDKHQGHVQVEMYYGSEGKTKTEWIRVMQAYAGKEFGQYFLPEVDTEVIVGFLLGDINKPIVLGCLYNNVDKIPKKTANDKNTIKKIMTKGGHELIFDDKAGEESIIIRTKKKLNIKLEDKEEKISILDDAKKNGVIIDTKKGSVVIMAKSQVVIKAGSEKFVVKDGKGIDGKGSKITLTSKGDITLKGTNAKLEGKANTTIKGSAGAKVQSGGVTELKGTMVKIN